MDTSRLPLAGRNGRFHLYPDPIMSFIVNLKIVRGTTFGPYQILCKDAAGAAVPLAGWSAEAHAREVNTGPLVIDLLPTVAVDDAAGAVVISEIASSITNEYPETLLVWDLILITPEGKRVPPFVSGEITIETPTTHS